MLNCPPPPLAQRLLPVLRWLPAYRREWALPDLLAGLAVWAVMVPEGMAYAGIVGGSGNFFEKLWALLQHLPSASPAPVLTGLLSLAAMVTVRRLAPAIPAALIVAVAATLLVGLVGGEAAGISVIGELPSGLPH